MANKQLFTPWFMKNKGKKKVINEAGGLAYQTSNEQALAIYAVTGCLNGTFYASAHDQLADILKLTEDVDPVFIAKVALYARQKGYMKDLPALLLAVLSVKSPGLMAEIFDRVIDNPKMLRNFVQIMRSGVVGRKSLGSLPKRMIIQWMDQRSDENLFYGSVGQSPSLADVIKMTHPRPQTKSREALYAYLIGRDYDKSNLPDLVRAYEKYKSNTNPGMVPVPDVPFQMLTGLPLREQDWVGIAQNASWTMTRMNLNTFQRHGVFKIPVMVEMIANRLRSPRLVEKARVFPYQLMTTWMNLNNEIPDAIREALQDAMELALKNVPRIPGNVYVFPDVSGSMHSPVTGYRRGSTTATRCIDIAALVAAAMMRRNPQTKVIPFECSIVNIKLNPRDTVMTNAEKLANIGGGGTNCSAPLKYLANSRADVDLVIYVSDNESWADNKRRMYRSNQTQTMKHWSVIKQRNPKAKMICIDIQPYTTVQAHEREDIVNVAGFSDQVFKLIAEVARGSTGPDYWVGEIKKMNL